MGLTVLIASLAFAWAAVQPGEARAQGAPAHPLADRVLTVNDAVTIALETQPQIQARLSEYAAARFRVDQALAPLLPQFAASVSTTRSRGTVLGRVGAPTAVVTRDFAETFGARVALSQLLFDFGKTSASTDASRRLADISLEDVELQRQLITLAVKEAFTNINFAERLIRVSLQALERAELNLRSARGFFQVGTRPKSDVIRAEVDIANARVDVIRARNAERVARVALNTAMGLPADAPTRIHDNLVHEPFELDRQRLLEEALRRRPEYRQVRLGVDAADAVRRRATRDFLPDVTGSGSYGATRSDLNEAWEVTLALTWSIFDGGSRVARHREALANLEAAQARVRALELEVGREVDQAVLAVSETEERIQATRVAVESAQELFRLAQGRFDAGVGTILELTDAQLALTLAQNTEAEALADFRIALARLERAVGRR